MANDKQNHLAKKINNLSVIQDQESLIWKDKKIYSKQCNDTSQMNRNDQ